MSHNNPENNNNIENQVRNFLSGIGGEAGDYLNQSLPAAAPQPTQQSTPPGSHDFGNLEAVTLLFTCQNCRKLHVLSMPLDRFVELFCGEEPAAYFQNFRFGTDPAKIAKLNQMVNDTLFQCKEFEKASRETNELLIKTKKLADAAAIENSHLKVEVDCLRRELDRVKAGQDYGQTETALDYRPESGRRWTLWTAIRGFRLIGRSGEGK